MTYWTLPEDEIGPAVTLCERHALEATNLGSPVFGVTEPFGSMEEAAVTLDAILSIFGDGTITSMGFTSSEIGHCDECKAELESFHKDGGAA